MKNYIKIFYSNVRSLNNKIEKLQSTVRYFKYDVFLLAQTWPSDCKTDNLILEDYVIYRTDREYSMYQTCEFYYDKSGIDSNGKKCGKTMLFICLYIPPDKANCDILKEIESLLLKNVQDFDSVFIV